MATIQDVAKAAGVSAMTVSNVINDHPNVRRATREKVLEAMARLDYRVNLAARNLRKGRTGTIGLAIPGVNSAHYGELAVAIVAAAVRYDLRVSIEQTGALRENELAALSLSRNRLYDGLLLSPVGMGSADAEWLNVDYPVVILGELIIGGPVDHVAMPDVDASRAATRHLIDRGCRRIAILCGPMREEVDVSSLRHTGYRQALEDAGIRVDPALTQSMEAFTMRAGAQGARETVESGLGFDGAFCVTDTLAMGVLRGLADVEVQVPEQVKVIGFDNVESSEFLVPSLSTIDPDQGAMAERAVALLARRIGQAELPQDREEFVSHFSLVVRESTGG